MFAWVSLDHMSSGWKFTIISVGSGLVTSAKDLCYISSKLLFTLPPLVSPPTPLAIAFFLSLFALLAFGLHFYRPLSDFIYVPVSKSLFSFSDHSFPCFLLTLLKHWRAM